MAKVIADEGIETIVTTGPPHSLHLIGLGLKKDQEILGYLYVGTSDGKNKQIPKLDIEKFVTNL